MFSAAVNAFDAAKDRANMALVRINVAATLRKLATRDDLAKAGNHPLDSALASEQERQQYQAAIKLCQDAREECLQGDRESHRGIWDRALQEESQGNLALGLRLGAHCRKVGSSDSHPLYKTALEHLNKALQLAPSVTAKAKVKSSAGYLFLPGGVCRGKVNSPKALTN